jgi:demethylmenaquinone methyltransferase / 2-methoxy-6-polyprenyl-1,4-benzoquinol methylase
MEPGLGDTNRFAVELFTPLAPRYDRLAEVLSMGQNNRWRRTLVDQVVAERPRRILDVATGTAGIAIELAERTSAQVIGYDLTLPMLAVGAQRISEASLENRVRLVAGRAESLPFGDDSFDAVTFAYLLRYVEDPAATIGELARVVRPGGVLANLEFLKPQGQVAQAAWWCYTRAILPLGGWITGGRAWRDVGRFLGPSIAEHYRRYPLSWTTNAWRAAGLEQIVVRPMSLGGGLVMWGHKASG